MRYFIQYNLLIAAMLLFITSCAVEGRNEDHSLSLPMESMYCSKNSCTIINKDSAAGVTESSQEILHKLNIELEYALSGEGAYRTFLVSPANKTTQVVFINLDSAFINAGINPHKVLVLLSSNHFRKDIVEKTEQMVSLQSLKDGLALHNVGEKEVIQMEAVFVLTEVPNEFEGLKNKLASDHKYPFTVNFSKYAAN